jgi:hypothetical protein
VLGDNHRVSAPAWVSYLALGVAVLVAGWNMYEWRSSGPQLELVVHDRPPLFPPGSRLPAETWVLVVECLNRGRGSANIHDFWLEGPDGESWARCHLSPISDHIPTVVSGRSRVRWIIDADTLDNIGLPRREDGALALRPKIRWGADEELEGVLAEFYVRQDKRAGLFPDSGVGQPTLSIRPGPPESAS